MSPDHDVAPLEWIAAATAAAILHGLVVALLAAGDVATTHGAGGASGAREATRLRIALASPRGEATKPTARSEAARASAPAQARPDDRARAEPPQAPSNPPRALSDRAPAPAELLVPAGATAERRAPDTAPPAVAAARVPSRPGAPGTQTSAPAPGHLEHAPPGDASGASAAGRARADYFDGVSARMHAVRAYPRRARLEGIEGMVLLRLAIDREGRLEDCTVVESAGERVLDRGACRTARRAAPFGPVPPGFDERDLTFELPVEFTLDE